MDRMYVCNVSNEGAEELLPLPTMNFGQPQEGAKEGQKPDSVVTASHRPAGVVRGKPGAEETLPLPTMNFGRGD